MTKKNLSTVSVKMNTTFVAPKMMTSDWDQVDEHMEQIRELARRVALRKKVYTNYEIVHLAEYVEDELIGQIYKLMCSGTRIYFGMVCKWSVEYDRYRPITCKRCLKLLGKNTTEVHG